MKQVLYQQKGFLSTVFTALLIIAIAVTTKYFDSLFVPETGNIKIFGGIGVILAVGLIFRLKYIRVIIGFLSLIAVLGMTPLIFMAKEPFILPLSILVAALALINYFLLFSKSLKTYVDRK